MSMLVEPLSLRTPLAAFNGGLVVDPQMEVARGAHDPGRPRLPHDRAARVVRALRLGLPRRRLARPRPGRAACRRARRTRCSSSRPSSRASRVRRTSRRSSASATTTAPSRLQREPRRTSSATMSPRRARSRTTSTSRIRTPTRAASSRIWPSATRIPADEIATIGDMPNDVLMFARSGLSIAMGNSDREVQRAARRVTSTNDEDGFANAVERFILREGG